MLCCVVLTCKPRHKDNKLYTFTSILVDWLVKSDLKIQRECNRFNETTRRLLAEENSYMKKISNLNWWFEGQGPVCQKWDVSTHVG